MKILSARVLVSGDNWRIVLRDVAEDGDKPMLQYCVELMPGPDAMGNPVWLQITKFSDKGQVLAHNPSGWTDESVVGLLHQLVRKIS